MHRPISPAKALIGRSPSLESVENVQTAVSLAVSIDCEWVYFFCFLRAG